MGSVGYYQKACTLNHIIHELIWFLKGDTNIAYLKEQAYVYGRMADEQGNWGPVYGINGARGQNPIGHIDQISQVVNQIKNNPDHGVS